MQVVKKILWSSFYSNNVLYAYTNAFKRITQAKAQR